MKLLKLALRLPKEKSHFKSLPSFALSEEDQKSIQRTPFFQALQPIHRRQTTVEDDSTPVIPQIIKSVAEYIPLDASGKLMTKKPPNVPSPFEIYKGSNTPLGTPIIAEENEAPQRVAIGKFPRLSVTKLLTHSWCELREFYSIYSRQPMIKTKQMWAGNKLHEKLEHSIHPPVDYDDVDGVSLEVERTPLTVEFEWLFENLLRLRSLIVNGEAREIYTFCFIHKQTGEFLNLEKEYDLDEYLLVTGIIDYLRLNEVFSGYEDHMNEFIKQVEVEDYSTSKISVIDVKTRASSYIPGQTTVVANSKLQIMYYNKMLKQFKDLETSLKLFEMYFKLKGIDIDEPIPLKRILAILDKHPTFFTNDFTSVHDGEEIHPFIKPSLKSYEPLELDLPHSKPFLDSWKQPVTLRYFILRNSQLRSQISHLLDDNDLNIQYYFREEMFQEVNFSYHDDFVLKNNIDSMKFWFGAKDPDPIEPTTTNVTSKCSYCDFRDYCSVYTEAISLK